MGTEALGARSGMAREPKTVLCSCLIPPTPTSYSHGVGLDYRLRIGSQGARCHRHRVD